MVYHLKNPEIFRDLLSFHPHHTAAMVNNAIESAGLEKVMEADDVLREISSCSTTTSNAGVEMCLIINSGDIMRGMHRDPSPAKFDKFLKELDKEIDVWYETWYEEHRL